MLRMTAGLLSPDTLSLMIELDNPETVRELVNRMLSSSSDVREDLVVVAPAVEPSVLMRSSSLLEASLE